jgi:hypothetical protein
MPISQQLIKCKHCGKPYISGDCVDCECPSCKQQRLGQPVKEAALSSSALLGRVLTCVYCGKEYPQGTPAWGNQVLTDHIKVCEKHPMRQLEADNAKLRKALIGLVGAEKPEELAQMEHAIRMLPAPDEDKANTINALHAIRDTQRPNR